MKNMNGNIAINGEYAKKPENMDNRAISEALHSIPEWRSYLAVGNQP